MQADTHTHTHIHTHTHTHTQTRTRTGLEFESAADGDIRALGVACGVSSKGQKLKRCTGLPGAAAAWARSALEGAGRARGAHAAHGQEKIFLSHEQHARLRQSGKKGALRQRGMQVGERTWRSFAILGCRQRRRRRPARRCCCCTARTRPATCLSRRGQIEHGRTRTCMTKVRRSTGRLHERWQRTLADRAARISAGSNALVEVKDGRRRRACGKSGVSRNRQAQPQH
jgi:hypothetical protein